MFTDLLNWAEVLNWGINFGIVGAGLYYWGYRHHKPPNAANSQGSHNLSVQGNGVTIHTASRELTPTEQSFKETIDILALQLQVKQQTIDRYDREFCQMKQELIELRDYKAKHQVLEFKYDKIKKKLSKYGLKLPLMEIGH